MSSSRDQVKQGVPSVSSLPTEYKVGSARLSIMDDDADPMLPDSWQELELTEGAGTAKGDNVRGLVFDYNLTLTQKSKTASCTLKWAASELGTSTVKGGATNYDPIVIETWLYGEGSITLTGDIVAAHQLPLAKRHSKKIARAKLSILPAQFKAPGKGTPPARVLVSHIKAFLSGIDEQDLDNRWNRLQRTDRHVLALESKAQSESLGSFKNCRIKTKMGSNDRILLVEVYRGTQDEEAEGEGIRYDPEKNIGQSYILNAPILFPVPDKKDEKKDGPDVPPVLGRSDPEEWVLDVAPESEDDRSGAIFVGTIVNSISSKYGSVSSWVNKEEDNVSLDPIYNDVQGDRAYAAIGHAEEDRRLASQASHGFQVDPVKLNRPKTEIPIDSLFGDLKCDPVENQLVADDVVLPDDIASGLNQSQIDSIVMSVKNKVSVIQGPPGTGKSSTLAALMAFFYEHKGEKIAGVAVQNVAVDALLASAVRRVEQRKPQRIPRFVRFYSESMIFKQWAAGDHSRLDSLYHIDRLRLAQAQRNPGEWEGYLLGREELSTFGRIDNAELMGKYMKETTALTREVLSTTDGLFCTAASLGSSVLYEEQKTSGDRLDPGKPTGEIKFFYPASTIVFDEAGTVHRPHLYIPVMAIPGACRLVLAGDSKQLPAFVANPTTKNFWPDCYLEKVMERRFPWLQLNVQYRMHDELYAHLIATVYKSLIHSAYLTSNPSPFLQKLLAQPTQLVTGGESYQLGSFLHFIDVAHGIQESEEAGSSWNMAEVDATDALVRSLLRRSGVTKKDIGVMTGYKAQRKLLKKKAQQNGWADIFYIGTIDAFQGSQVPISCLSLVTTRGYPTFMGDRARANVATSRQQEALYFVGQANFWFQNMAWKKRSLVMHDILRFMQNKATELSRPDFVVRAQGWTPSAEDAVAPVTDDISSLLLDPPSAKGKEVAPALTKKEALQEHERHVLDSLKELFEERRQKDHYYQNEWHVERMRERMAELGLEGRQQLPSEELDKLVEEHGRCIRRFKREMKEMRQVLENELRTTRTDLAHELVLEATAS